VITAKAPSKRDRKSPLQKALSEPGLVLKRVREKAPSLGLWRSRLRNRYAGQRCFIIGNGPSLKHTDLSLLRNELTFGANRLYMLFEPLGFSTTFYLVTDPNIAEHYHQEIDRVPAQKFLRPYHRHLFPKSRRNAIFIRDRARESPFFAYEPAFGLWTAGTITYVSMQLAYYMGFEKVILIGVDHSYAEQQKYIDEKRTVRDRIVATSEGNDPNHFSPDYYQPGTPWIVPNPEAVELAYRMAKFAFEREGREIVDATIGGKLQVFPKVDYLSLFTS
jgi:hypothetical protein